MLTISSAVCKLPPRCRIITLTSSSEFEFGAGACALLVVANETLVHSFIFFLHGFDSEILKDHNPVAETIDEIVFATGKTDREECSPEQRVVMLHVLAVLEPSYSFDGVSFVAACEYGRATEVYGLSGRLHGGFQRRGHR